MLLKAVFLILFLTAYGLVGQLYGDECDDKLDLSLSCCFTFKDKNISLEWELLNQTNCSVEYHLTVTDEELGTIQDIQTEDTSIQMEPMSPCVTFDFNVSAINKAFPAVEGPLVNLPIMFGQRVQTAPLLHSVDIRATSINMTFILEGNANRCPLISMYVDGGNFFNQSVSLENMTDQAPTNVAVEIRSLLPNTMYYLQVYVENSAGMSPPTGLAVQTLDLSVDEFHEDFSGEDKGLKDPVILGDPKPPSGLQILKLQNEYTEEIDETTNSLFICV